MEMGILCLTVMVETWGTLYFFDTFLGRRKAEKICRYRFLAYFMMMLAANVVGYWIGMWKLPLFILGYVLLGRMYDKTGWVQAAFFAVLNY
ncbi:MAG: ATP-binding protein, partial [Lachnospiraceae bacterium]|nr:ATP-binding protein [Lachnospiraceae bacterium]